PGAPPVTVAEAPQTASPARRPQRPTPVSTPAPAVTNFKESGLPTAPITIEIYTDYECPACAALYRDFVPTLIAQYVQAGKVKMLHRDVPLPQHQYSRLAARYANAAGRMGQYDLVVNQLFQTQNTWGGDGSVDKQVAQVLAPGVMQKVRALVENDATLDDTVNTDVAMATKDAIRQTPTLVVVAKGKRQAIAGIPDFTLLKTYLEQLGK
ncbi:MAG TPA: thioredoxin domain-containing protein, partial [Candidatus Sulfopaludibacter sp.]|nr:thioredoxin domain-containing protein [Candidatus Sulfopaludibacter sp.]